MIIPVSAIISLLLLLIKYNYWNDKIYCKSKSIITFTGYILERYFFKNISQLIFIENQKIHSNQKEIEKNKPGSSIKINEKIKISTRHKINPKGGDLKSKKTLFQLPKTIKNKSFIQKIELNNYKHESLLADIIQDTDSDEDFYIDSYKRNNILFGDMKDTQFYGLAELIQDSEPLDSLSC